MVVAEDASNSMQTFGVIVVTDVFRDGDNVLFVKGRQFKEVKAAHSDWPRDKVYPSLRYIGCYECRSGLKPEEDVFPFATVVGKMFPFHMNLDCNCDPLESTQPSNQWWILIRFKHTCPPITFRDK